MCRFVPLKNRVKSSKGPITRNGGAIGAAFLPSTRREENPRAYRRCRRKREDRAAVLFRIEDRMG